MSIACSNDRCHANISHARVLFQYAQAVLASRAASFKDGFQGAWDNTSKENQMPTFKVAKGIRYEPFLALLRYIYTGRVDFTVPVRYVQDDVPTSKREDVDELLDCALQYGLDILQAAEAYDIRGLRHQAIKFLAGFTLYPNKLLMVLIVAHRHDVVHLKEYCLQMLAKHDPLSMLALLSEVDMPFDVLEAVNNVRLSHGLLAIESVKCQKMIEENKDEELLSFINERNLDIDKCNVLHLMSGFGLADGIKVLLEKGADVNSYDDDGNTPLHYAIIGAKPDNVSVLLKSGANPYVKNAKGRMPLDELEHLRTLESETQDLVQDIEERRTMCEQLVSSHSAQVLKPMTTEESKVSSERDHRANIVLNPDFVKAMDPNNVQSTLELAPASKHGGFLPTTSGRSLGDEIVQFMLPRTSMALLKAADQINKSGTKAGSNGTPEQDFTKVLFQQNFEKMLVRDLMASGVDTEEDMTE